MEELKRQQAEEERQKKIVEGNATSAIMKVIQKVRVATPETFADLKKDLDDVLTKELVNSGSQRQKMIEEVDKSLEQAKKCIEKIKLFRSNQSSTVPLLVNPLNPLPLINAANLFQAAPALPLIGPGNLFKAASVGKVVAPRPNLMVPGLDTLMTQKAFTKAPPPGSAPKDAPPTPTELKSSASASSALLPSTTQAPKVKAAPQIKINVASKLGPSQDEL